ncbi:GNAT family N-acetyltransferase [Sulfidibacter corallicola]|uniref:GNAT family N-acetyltransferase n=1 Tax=Sulfidibacter corallicola TaxID=2818388 RepID=A0A8A4TMV8_SULCO|nr:GNAT family N-acetyltransferase [Sulfidibacter corallicola]
MVLCDDQPVATGRWREEPVGEADLARIAVVKEHRGKKLSAIVVMELEAWARDLGMRRAWLEPHIYLERLYGGLGYHKAGTAAKAGDHQLIRMEKELNGGEASNEAQT